MQISVINKNKLERTLRIDSEYYQPRYIAIEKMISKLSDIKPLTDLCRVSDGNHMSIAEHFSFDEGIPYYRGQDITDFFLDNITPVYIPRNIYESPMMKRSLFKSGDVLLSIVGTIGSLSLVTKNIREATGSCKIAILRPNNIEPEYLATYLMSKYGNEQIKRNTRGAVQTGLILEDFSQIFVYKASDDFQTLIGKIIKESLERNDCSMKAYKDAEQMLLSELGLLNWKPKHSLSFVKNFSDTLASGRIDAEYFQPMYEEILDRFQINSKTEVLKNITTLIGHPSNPPYASEHSRNKTFIITQKHLGNYFPSDNFWADPESLYTTDDFISKNKQYLLQANDIILYSVGAYIGKANIYNSHIKATLGSFLTLIRPDHEKINPYYLLVFLNSDTGKQMTRRCSRGMAQQYVYPYDIKEFIIPIISKSKQVEIEKKMLESLDTKALSKSLLDIAKRGVEMAIEKSEKDAQNWIEAELKKSEII